MVRFDESISFFSGINYEQAVRDGIHSVYTVMSVVVVG